ncbi:unnamed protein product [Closterium sp. NIES-64]|nr:unnamed protein product [Closterium sp. NIES-64]
MSAVREYPNDPLCADGGARAFSGEAEGADVFRVVIVGAGPAGLALANYLLARGGGRFHVSVIEKGVDPRAEVEEAAEIARRYAMGLSIRAMHCLMAIPGVMDKVQPVLVNPHEMVMPAFGRLIRFSVPKVGADGVRSYVRNLLAARTWDFPVHTDRVYHDWTVVSIPVPPDLTPTSLFFTAKVTNTKNIGAVAMPQVGGEMCLVWGWKSTDPPLDWLSLASPAAAKQYLHERLPWLDVPEEAAWKLLKQKPRTSMQVKCWRYHDSDAQVALIGDAAHSTLPSLGQGCNASITDALVLGRLLLGEAVSENDRVPRPLGKDGAAAGGGGGDGGASIDVPEVEELRAGLAATLSRYSALQVRALSCHMGFHSLYALPSLLVIVFNQHGFESGA